MKKEDPQYEILREVKYRECIEQEASWLSSLFFHWTSTIINLGKSKVLRENDLFDIIEQEKFKWGFQRFTEFLASEERKNLPRNFFRALFFTSRWVIINVIILSVISNLLQFAGRVLLYFPKNCLQQTFYIFLV